MSSRSTNGSSNPARCTSRRGRPMRKFLSGHRMAWRENTRFGGDGDSLPSLRRGRKGGSGLLVSDVLHHLSGCVLDCLPGFAAYLTHRLEALSGEAKATARRPFKLEVLGCLSLASGFLSPGPFLGFAA